MEFNRGIDILQFVLLAAVIVATIAFSGCQGLSTTFSLPSGTYRAYPFTYSEGERLDVTVNATGTPPNVMILHGGNFSRYQQGENYYADEYREEVISTKIAFSAPVDGEYYLVMENRGPDEAKINFNYISHTEKKYEAEPLVGTIHPAQKGPLGVSGSLVPTPPTTAIPVQTTQPGAVPAQTGQPGMRDAEQLSEEGEALLGEGNLTGALVLFDQAIQLDPDNARIWNDKAAVLLSLGRYEEALAAADRATTLDPEYVWAWKGKTIALLNLERYEEAVIAAERITTLNPEDKVAWAYTAVALGNLGRYSEALTAADRATMLDPNYAFAWNTKGWILAENGRYVEAIASFDRALEIDPNYENARNNKAVALAKLGS